MTLIELMTPALSFSCTCDHQPTHGAPGKIASLVTWCRACLCSYWGMIPNRRVFLGSVFFLGLGCPLFPCSACAEVCEQVLCTLPQPLPQKRKQNRMRMGHSVMSEVTGPEKAHAESSGRLPACLGVCVRSCVSVCDCAWGCVCACVRVRARMHSSTRTASHALMHAFTQTGTHASRHASTRAPHFHAEERDSHQKHRRRRKHSEIGWLRQLLFGGPQRP